MYEILARKEPYMCEDVLNTIAQIRDEGKVPDVRYIYPGDDITKELVRLMQRCWAANPGDRPVSINIHLLFFKNIHNMISFTIIIRTLQFYAPAWKNFKEVTINCEILTPLISVPVSSYKYCWFFLYCFTSINIIFQWS